MDSPKTLSLWCLCLFSMLNLTVGVERIPLNLRKEGRGVSPHIGMLSHHLASSPSVIYQLIKLNDSSAVNRRILRNEGHSNSRVLAEKRAPTRIKTTTKAPSTLSNRFKNRSIVRTTADPYQWKPVKRPHTQTALTIPKLDERPINSCRDSEDCYGARYLNEKPRERTESSTRSPVSVQKKKKKKRIPSVKRPVSTQPPQVNFKNMSLKELQEYMKRNKTIRDNAFTFRPATDVLQNTPTPSIRKTPVSKEKKLPSNNPLGVHLDIQKISKFPKTESRGKAHQILNKNSVPKPSNNWSDGTVLRMKRKKLKARLPTTVESIKATSIRTTSANDKGFTTSIMKPVEAVPGTTTTSYLNKIISSINSKSTTLKPYVNSSRMRISGLQSGKKQDHTIKKAPIKSSISTIPPLIYERKRTTPHSTQYGPRFKSPERKPSLFNSFWNRKPSLEPILHRKDVHSAYGFKKDQVYKDSNDEIRGSLKPNPYYKKQNKLPSILYSPKFKKAIVKGVNPGFNPRPSLKGPPNRVHFLHMERENDSDKYEIKNHSNLKINHGKNPHSVKLNNSGPYRIEGLNKTKSSNFGLEHRVDRNPVSSAVSDAASNYLKNPYGADFIRLEVAQDRLERNQTKPGSIHIPLMLKKYQVKKIPSSVSPGRYSNPKLAPPKRQFLKKNSPTSTSPVQSLLSFLNISDALQKFPSIVKGLVSRKALPQNHKPPHQTSRR